MYLCYYTYPGGSHHSPAVAPTLTAAPQAATIPVTEPLLVPATQATLPHQTGLPTLTSQFPLTVCRKRTSDDLMSQSPMVTNGTSPPHLSGSDNEAKKVKLEQSSANGPSRVVHIRSLPPDCTEADVVQLGLPYGKMSNVLLLKQKNQAFLEFLDEQAAVTMVSFHQQNPAQIRMRSVYVQFSNHKELKTDQANSFQNATAQAALQAASAVMGGPTEDGQKRTTLRIIVEHLVYPVGIEVLYQIFSKFGKVLKMIIFTKNNSFQALIQMSDPVAANAAKLSLDGQNIYNGCCTLRIDYSKLNNLNVKYNNDKSRDFTNPNLPSGDPGLDQAMPFGGPGSLVTPVVPGMGAAPLSAYGAANVVGGTPVYAQVSQMSSYGVPSPMGAARLMTLNAAAAAGNAVLLVSNLDEQKVTPDALFTLFGVYGDVHRVKILFNKKDNALVQMAEPHQAQLAIAHLDKVKVWGKSIRVTQSKHTLVQMPKEGQPDAGLTKDFTNSPLHRFKRPGSKNCQNIFPPSTVLHLSNIPPNIEEDFITEAFQEHGQVKAFKFFPKDRKMALIQMASVDEAVTALIAMHNYPLSDTNHLRVSFSKSTI
ncbi:polypyrimidine tract-binding protein 3-like isoform X2 [Crassostrea virginica]|uniref:Polypyrimidine tract-binding protein 1-like isoform X2 n=1 Tax=Crassostrea virginica TaxID=6565 RepID=A0A8B8CE83_CRAVI|nr:polypyrimidine tract-binding protein 1-like isoform X4 [Crassostrea virginica]XP_022314435.1 polypyrimidine tract-binding protein 1-like isoform X2 [Crassostrea virginica]